MTLGTWIAILVGGIAGAFALGWFVRSQLGRARLRSAEQRAQQVLQEARRDAEALTAGIVEAFERPLEAPATPGAEVSFDDDASPWYTLCEVRGVDRPGLLHAITVGFASAGIDVHSAQVRTLEGQVVDRFELTDRNGRKVGDGAKRAVVEALTDGVKVGRRRRLLRRNGG